MKLKRGVELGPLKESIKKILITRVGGLNIKQISWELGFKDKEFNKLIKLALDQLMAADVVTVNKKYKFKYQWPDNVIIGIIDINRSGNGYVSSNLYNEDIFIHVNNRLNSLNQDTVSIQLIKGTKSKLEGKVKAVILRSKTKFIG